MVMSVKEIHIDEKKTLVHQQILGQSQTISKKPLGDNAEIAKLKK